MAPTLPGGAKNPLSRCHAFLASRDARSPTKGPPGPSGAPRSRARRGNPRSRAPPPPSPATPPHSALRPGSRRHGGPGPRPPSNPPSLLPRPSRTPKAPPRSGRSPHLAIAMAAQPSSKDGSASIRVREMGEGRSGNPGGTRARSERTEAGFRIRLMRIARR